jgi:hypothetical protein
MTSIRGQFPLSRLTMNKLPPIPAHAKEWEGVRALAVA